MLKKAVFYLIFIIFPLILSAQNADKIKSILLKIENQSSISDEWINYSISMIDKEMKVCSDADLAIWHSVYAQLLESYFNEHRFDILQRTALSDNSDEDFTTWDAFKFTSEIINHYQASLKRSDLLQNIVIERYKPILDSLVSVKYRPTLYDFLAFRALDYFSERINYLPVPSTPFDINNPVFLSNNDVFCNYKITSEDPFSGSFLALSLFQQIINYNLNNKNTLPLIDATLRRLSYIYDNCSLTNKQSLYLQTLFSLAKKYENYSGYEDIAYSLAAFYQNRTSDVDSVLNKEYQYDLKTAIDWYIKAISFNPASLSAEKAKENIEDIKRSSINAVFCNGTTLIPEKNSLISYQYKNCDTIYNRIIYLSEKEYDVLSKLGYNTLKKTLLSFKNYLSFKIPVERTVDYREKNVPYIFPPLKSGKYILIYNDTPLSSIQDPQQIKIKKIKVTNISINYRINNNKIDIFVNDRNNGKPLNKAIVTIDVSDTYSNSKANWKTQTDRNGKAIIVFDKKLDQRYLQFSIKVKYKKEEYVEEEKIGIFVNNSPVVKENTPKVFIFTDRAIYRQGQTVYYKGIVSENKNNSYSVLPHYTSEIRIINSNNETVFVKSHISNDFGSFSGSFVIPSTFLNGNLRIEVLNNSRNIKVEDYKRPSFEVAINKPVKEYSLKDSVIINGFAQAFAGFPIDGASVKYRVSQQSFFPYCSWCVPSQRHEICSGETSTDKKGIFNIGFVPQIQSSDLENNPFFQYVITADVSDLNGETHSASSVIIIGKNSLFFEISIPDIVQADHFVANFIVKAINSEKQKINTKIHYKIIKIVPPDEYLHQIVANVQKSAFFVDFSTPYGKKIAKTFPFIDFKDANNKSLWKEVKEIEIGVFDSQKDSVIHIKYFNKLKNSYYKFIIWAKDKYGETVQVEKYVLFTNSQKGECFAYEPIFISIPQQTVSAGEDIRFVVGSYLKDANVLIEAAVNDKVVFSHMITFNKDQTYIDYTVPKETEGIFTVSALLIKDGFFYQKFEQIKVENKKSKLEIEWLTYKNQTLPGSSETWKFIIKGSVGEKIISEVLCSMYDASLDAFASNLFSIPNLYAPSVQYKLSLNRSDNFFDFYSSDNYFYRSLTRTLIRQYPQLILRLKPYYLDKIRYASEASALQTELASFEKFESSSSLINDESSFKEPLRKNFEETAFFYPQLETDIDGNATVSFTVPESLTKWKFQGLAHTKDLKTIYFEKFLNTIKPLMTVVNAPRFVRESDEIDFAVKIVSQNDKPLSGILYCEIYDALLNIPIFSSNTSFNVRQGESFEHYFPIFIPDNIQAIKYKIQASANISDPNSPNEIIKFTDGEEQTINVLPNKILVTETLPLWNNGYAHKSFSFKSFIDNNSISLANYSYSLEYTSNPVWNAILSLPYLMSSSYDCNNEIFNRYYANSISCGIVNSYPLIKNVFENWRDKQVSAFCTNLEKNQELKNISLEETPWLLDGLSENEQKQRTGALFDNKNNTENIRKELFKLQDNQNQDGGWPWFKGGTSNSYITMNILSGLGKLSLLKISNNLNKRNIAKAIDFIDREQLKKYKNITDYNSKNNLSFSEIQYLYTRSLYSDIYMDMSFMDMYNYYLKSAAKNWKDQSVYMQGMIALSLWRTGNETEAKKIIENIKSKSQYSEEMGMYWKNISSGYYWYEQPVERQVLLIEAFNIITEDYNSVDNMKIWLLKQKQTQSWGNTRATADACFALLFQNQNNLYNEAGITISVGKDVFDLDYQPEIEAGTGYFKKEWNASVSYIPKSMGNIEISKKNKGISWGAAYWQYFEVLDKINNTKGPLSVSKQLYVVNNNNYGEVLFPVTEYYNIKIGDKVRVRLIIESDRTLEFVHLKDSRGAAFEPLTAISQYKIQGSLRYYETTKDASTSFFFETLPKGKYVFEYTLVATQSGVFNNGIASIQCLYAPEFSANSNSVTVKIVSK